MEIKTTILPKDDEVGISDVKITYCQQGDCTGNGDYNEIIISTADGGGGNYFILKTKRWAINDVQELVDLLNDFKKRTK